MDFGKVDNVDKVDFSMPQDHSDNKLLFQHLPEVQQANVYLGCPAWADKSFIGKIYPPKTKDYLPHYSKNFQTIELNSTYYAIPKKETISGWKEKALPGFKFCPKIPAQISHEQQMRYSQKTTQLFVEHIALWQEYLGICFLVLPPSFDPSRYLTLTEYANTFPLPLAIEFRHPQWFKNTRNVDTTFHELRRHNVSPVITDVAGRRDCLHQRLTTNTVAIRFVGNNLHSSDYKRLDDWVQRITLWIANGLQTVYFFVHEPQSDLAIDAAIYFAQQLSVACPKATVKAPQLLKLDIQQTFF